MKKWLTVIGFTVAGLIGWALAGSVGKIIGKSTVAEYEQGQTAGIIEAGQALAAKELREQLPLRVDDVTTLESVISQGATLIYNYKVKIKYSDVDLETFNKHMRTQLLHNVCNQKDMSTTIKHGGKYAYLYHSADGLIITQFNIGKSECGLK